MDPIENAEQVAVVGSPSSNYEVTLDLLDSATHEPLVGSMLCLAQPLAEGEELALGVVTEVTTTNQWHTNPLLRGVVKTRGSIPGMSGDLGDVRAAGIRLQACYRRADADAGDVGSWRQSGPSLRMSPPTGTAVRRVTNEVVDELMAGEEDLHFLGHLHGTDVRAPLSVRDFSGPRGAFHAAVFGSTGSGKAIDVDTPVPTPDGWTRMGDLRAGDAVFDEGGRPTTVLAAHDVMTGRDCYEVVFSDGSRIVADGEHLWFTEDTQVRLSASAARRLEHRRSRRPLLAPAILTHLRAQASASAPEETITLAEVATLTGLGPSSSAVTSCARAVGAVGVRIQDHAFSYRAQSFQRTRELPVFAGRELLLALADAARAGKTSNPVFNPSLTPRLVHAAGQAPEWITMPDVARLVGVPPRNGALRRKIVGTGVRMAVLRVPLTVDLEARTVVRRLPASAQLYPRRMLLEVLAEHAANPVGDQRRRRSEGRVVTTEEIRATLRTAGGDAEHAVPVAQPLALPDADLPLDPYDLGIWLGDGRSSGAGITTADVEVVQHLRDAESRVEEQRGDPYGYSVTWDDALAPSALPERTCAVCGASYRPSAYRQQYCSRTCSARCRGRSSRASSSCTVCGVVLQGARPPARCAACYAVRTTTGVLRRLGVLRNKHVPAEYLRASEEQRRALLAGLLDSDGTSAASGAVHFDNTNRVLIDGVHELVCSLGYRPTVTEEQDTLAGRDCGPTWRISFTTADEVFRLTRKRSAHRERARRHNPAKTSHRYVVDVRPVASVPVRCITVDSPSRLYLAGRSMIPTHNTQMAAYYLAGQMRHQDHGIIVIDPQGQFASETGMAFSLQEWAREMGREVVVRRVSEDLRLEKDAPLLGELLAKTRFCAEIAKMSSETAGYLVDELVKLVRKRPDWETEDSEALLRALLQSLTAFSVLGRVYAAEDRQQRLREAIEEVLTDGDRFADVFRQFQPLHNLFGPTNPGGGARHSMWGTIAHVFDKASRAGAPAPLLVLDMSTSGQVSWVSSLLAGEEQRAVLEALRVLDQDSVKAAILRKACRTLKEASEAAFREGETLNTVVVFDEAWRYAPPVHTTAEEEVRALSSDLAGYARDTRKFGIGWLYVTQTPRSLNPDIWDQLAVRVMGYGLGGADLAKVAEHLDDPDHLKLYRGFAPPDSTKPKVYPFMVTGPVSPLSFTKAPLFLSAYTDFEAFREDNASWITATRMSLGLPVLSGTPARRGAGSGARAPGVGAGVRGAAPVAAPRRPPVGLADFRKEVERVRAHRATGGVDPGAGVGLSADAGFTGGLDSIDDEPPF